MLKAIFAASAVVFMFTGLARADISADLKFCAGLKISKERLACYDAAARIEERSEQKMLARPASPAPLPKALTYTPPATPTQSGFDGFYVAAAAGYDIATTKSESRPYFAGPGNDFSLFTPPDSVKGAKLGLVGGYNSSSGPLLLGLEARGTYTFSSASSQAVNTLPDTRLPTQIGWCTWGECIPFSTQPLLLSSQVRKQLRLERPWQFDASTRFGVISGANLFFSKIGVGVEETASISVDDRSGVTTCPNPVTALQQAPTFLPGNGPMMALSCGAISTGSIQTSITRTYSPVALFGIGIERNFGDYFARIEAEMTAHLVSGGAYYTPSVNLTAGYRF